MDRTDTPTQDTEVSVTPEGLLAFLKKVVPIVITSFGEEALGITEDGPCYTVSQSDIAHAFSGLISSVTLSFMNGNYKAAGDLFDEIIDACMFRQQHVARGTHESVQFVKESKTAFLAPISQAVY